MRTTLRAARLVAGIDLRRRLRNRSFLVQAVVGPVLLAAVISAAFAGGFGIDLTIGLVDLDRSELTADIQRALLDDGGDELRVEPFEDRAAAEEAMDDGDVAAVVVFPAGFGASIEGPRPAPIEVLVDQASAIGGAVARGVAAGVAARLDASRLTVAALVASGEAPPDRDELRALEPAVALDQRGAGDDLSPAALVAPGLGMLFLFFTVGAVARGLLDEQRQRVLDRVRAAPATLTAVLLGKGVAVVVLGVVSLGSLWLASTLLLGADWGHPLGVVVVVVAATLAVGGIASVVAAVARNEQAADTMATFVAFVLGILGGSLLPLSELPDGFDRLARFTPNGWAQEAFAELSAGGGTARDVLPEAGVLLGWAAVTAAIGLALLPRRLGAR